MTEGTTRPVQAKTSGRVWLALAGILFLALGLRLARLTFQPLWADEGYSIYFASLDPVALARATAADIHPPLYYYLLKLWAALLGGGDASLRLLSVVLGVLTIAATYALARRLVGQQGAVLSALLVAVSPFHVYYSQEVRMYALAGLLATLSTALLVEACRRESPAASDQPAQGESTSPKQRRWRALSLLYVITAALGLYTMYYSLFVPVAHIVYVLIRYRSRRRAVARWAGLVTVALVLYVPWILMAANPLSRYVAGKVSAETYTALDPVSFAGQVLAALAIGTPSPGRWLISLGAALLLGLAVLGAVQSIVRRGRAPREDDRSRVWSGALLITLVLVPLALGYLVNVVWPFHPPGFARLFVFCLPPLAMLAAEGLRWLADRGIAPVRQLARPVSLRICASYLLRLPVLVAALCTLFVAAALADFYVSPRYTRDDYRPIIRHMSALAHPDDVVVALYPWQLGFVRAYFIGSLPHLYFAERATDWATYPAIMRQDLERLGRDHGRLWFPTFERLGGHLERGVVEYLTTAHFPGLGGWYGDHRLYLFAFGGTGSVQPRHVTAGAGLRLEGAGISLEPLAAGRDAVRIELDWQATGAVPEQGQVTLRLSDEGNRTWIKRDSIPQNGLLPFSTWPSDATVADRHALPIPATTPPGSYRLLMSVFDRATGSNLPLAIGGQPAGNEVELGKIIISRDGDYRPPPSALGIPVLREVRFVGAPRLIGYHLRSTPLRPGHPVYLDLYWQAESAVTEDPTLFVQVLDRANKVWGLYEGPAVAPPYPPSRWVAGEILRGQISFLLAPDAPGGEYRIVVGWLKGRGKERLRVVGGGNQVVLTQAEAVTRRHITTLPRPEIPMDAYIGDAVQFLGYDRAPQAVTPGTTVRLTLYWRAMGRMDRPYVVFLHLVDGQGGIQAQKDNEPVQGTIPTTSWLPGEIISDVYELTLPAALPGGQYPLRVGMYDAATSVRLPVKERGAAKTGDYIDLGSLTVSSGP